MTLPIRPFSALLPARRQQTNRRDETDAKKTDRHRWIDDSAFAWTSRIAGRPEHTGRPIRCGRGTPCARDYFDRFETGDPGSDCGDSLLDLADVRFATSLHRIPADLGTGAITDAKQRKRLAKSIASYRDKHLPRGFDGALVIDVKSGRAQLVGISADGTEKPNKTTLPLFALGKPERLRQAMCKALAGLPVLKEP